MNVALVGCGVIADAHYQFIKKYRPDSEIFLCDINLQRASEFAKNRKVKKIYSDIDELINKEKINSMHITTPPGSHKIIAEKAITARIHVFIEKPITENGAEYKYLSELAEKEGVVLYGDYSTLGMPVVIQAIETIKSGSYGRLIAAHCNFADSESGNMIPYKNPNHWAYRLRGGVFQNMIDHPLSLILSVMETVEEYQLFTNSRNVLPYDCPDLLHLSLKNKNQIGSLTLSLGHGCHERRAQFLLEKGTITIDLGRQLCNYMKGSGQQNFIKKALSGIREGIAYSGGTLKNMFLGVSGKLTRNPGIAKLIENYYNVIENKESRLVRDELITDITRLLDEIWNQINYQPIEFVSEVVKCEY